MIRVLAVTSEWPTPDRPADAAFLTRQIDAVRTAGVHVDVEHFRGATNPLNYVNAWRRVRSRLRSEPYDIVHAHFGQAGLVVLPCPAPLVISFYGSDLEGIVGRRGTYTARGLVISRLSRVVARLADQTTVLSPSLARRLPKTVDPMVIPTAVDMHVFRPGSKVEARQALGRRLDGKLVLFGGDPEKPVKRYGLAKRTVDLLHDEAVELITIADLPPSSVALYMQACDALLVTSRHEGGPTTVKEALACRLPVVSVDVGDVRETVQGTPGCYVTSDDSAVELSRALAKALNEPSGPRSVPLPAILDQTKQAERLVALYTRLLARRASSGAAGRD